MKRPLPDTFSVLFFTGEDTVLNRRIEHFLSVRNDWRGWCGSIDEPVVEADVALVPAVRLTDFLHVHPGVVRLLPVIAYGHDDYLRISFLSGCSDYLKEPWSLEEMLLRANRVVRKEDFQFSWGKIRVSSQKLHGSDSTEELTFQEAQLLRLLAQNAGEVVTREAFYYTLWGKPTGSSRVIDVYVSRLRRKLRAAVGLTDSAELIRSARGIGYQLNS
jgi:DNA-binding winged helix-turn-helix (wHTH) protein